MTLIPAADGTISDTPRSHACSMGVGTSTLHVVPPPPPPKNTQIHINSRDGLPKLAADISLRHYSVDVTALNNETLHSTFTHSWRDAETDAFLSRALQVDKAAVRREHQRYAATVRAQRTQGLSRTDAIALHNAKDMLVATAEQLRNLITHAASTVGSPTLLDIGAGKGDVTEMLANGLGVQAAGVAAMEASAPLRTKLQAKGYRACQSFDELGDERFGAVALLNVLDRCDDPKGLLELAIRRLLPGGLLLIATALPYCDRVYEGRVGKVNANRPPKRPLILQPATLRCASHLGRHGFEKHTAAFAAAAFSSLPLRLVAWTRLPYLCMGDAVETWYTLDNALFVFRGAGEGGRRLTFLSGRNWTQEQRDA